MTDVAGRVGHAGSPVPTDAPEGPEATETDGRRLRRALNREAVVDALLDLYSEGDLRPATDTIAERAGISPRSLFRYFEDTDDLADEAIRRQLARALPLVDLDVTAEASFAARVDALVDQRFRLFDTVGQAAHVTRLRAPFQPRLADTLAQSRRFLREQLAALFEQELSAMDAEHAADALAAADVLTQFEAYQLLTTQPGRSTGQARSVVVLALTELLGTGSPT